MRDMNAAARGPDPGPAAARPPGGPPEVVARVQNTVGVPLDLATTSGLPAIVPGAGGTVRHGPLAAQTATVTIGLGGTSTATWNPALTVTVPALVTAGTCTATITHPVA